ncbi:spondin domain-containing protein [Desulfosarcina sp.]|uniref:spondin domain-containing protein n=1 Tax=Desulfosarcina sp. TaxID=2027861 RepID=UPI0029BC996D|nr:spondin domain-containing protein [Desulfosarcina sp.]MDX2453942.1 spondin domain-containing protein [Desulfosarcina sp.]MDX2491636.1 spondin domain-containing protein [Desulfosarcina sp.]
MVKILFKTLFAVVVGAVLSMGQAVAAEFTVTVKNLTNGIYFTPLLITAHDGETHLFETGSPASAALQAMAEGGKISGLIEMVGGEDRDTVANPVGDVLPPGGIVSDVYFNTNRTRNRYLSLVAMLLPTNDGFVGLDSLRIPRIPGTYRYYLVGYDAGTEANDERITGGGDPGVPGIPADPGGNAGTGGSGVADTDKNSTVHIHRGVIGDTDSGDGISDLDSTIHRWLNPVAEIVIEVHSRRHGRDH